MSMTAPLVEQLDVEIENLRTLNGPDPKRPHRYHEEKSEIAGNLLRIRNMLAGQWAMTPPEPPEPAMKPGTIQDRKGNVIRVDFGWNGSDRRPPKTPTRPGGRTPGGMNRGR